MAGKKTEAEICGYCWPEGWPGRDVAAACEHGEWKREDPGPSSSE